MNNLTKEYQQLKNNISTYFNECEMQMLSISDAFMNNYFYINNNILYISIIYLLNTYKYQTKLFYKYLVLNKLTDFNIQVISPNLDFGYIQYRFHNNKKYINEDNLFSAIDDIIKNNEYNNFDNDNFILDFKAFYNIYLCKHPDKYDISNKKQMSFVLLFFSYDVIDNYVLNPFRNRKPIYDRLQLIKETKHDFISNLNLFYLKDKYPNYFTDSVLNTIENSYLLFNSTNNFIGQMVNYTRNGYFLDNKINKIISITHDVYIDNLMFVNDILNQITFSYFDDKKNFLNKQLKENMDDSGYFSFINNISLILNYSSILIETNYLYKDSYKNITTEIENDLDLNNYCTEYKDNYMLLLNELIRSQSFSANDINILFELCRKILTELPNFIKDAKFEYSTNLVQLIL